MKTENAYRNALFVIVGTLCIALFLIVIALFLVNKYWLPASAVFPTQAPSQTPYPTYTPYPTFTAYPTLIQPTELWEWRSLDVYGFWVEMPSAWTLVEINKRSYSQSMDHCPAYEVDYSLDGPSRDNIIIIFLCGGRGGESTPCQEGTVILDESRKIARQFIDGQYRYGGYSGSENGKMYCDDGWGEWGIETMAMIANYQNSSGIFDLATVDRIVLSVQTK